MDDSLGSSRAQTLTIGLGQTKLVHISTILWVFPPRAAEGCWFEKHGSSSVSPYVNLDKSYKNPADTSSPVGAKFTLDSSAYWNGQNMRRTELIPQTTAAK